jgi:hypothetical protein
MKSLGIWAALAIIVLAAVFVEYSKRSKAPADRTAQAVVTVAIKNDLLRIAQAEMIYYSDHGEYASIETLTESGALSMKTPGRGVYEYSVEFTARGFVITARAKGEEAVRWPVLTMDERRQFVQTDPVAPESVK